MIAGAIGYFVLAAGTTAQVVQSRKAEKAGKRAAKVEQRRADVQTARERMKQVREARIKRAQVQQAAANTGAEGSAVIGAVSSIQSQETQNISFLDQVQGLSRQASIFRQQQAGYQSDAQTAGAVASLGGFTATNAPQLKKMF